uniref:Nuclear speckle splicing regulatory protein 1 n=1 Tax=Ciona savignyi TaxID=51511 RepID=H2ZR02_CIOSA
MSSKQYGLTIPKKKPTLQKTLKPRLAVFGDDSGDELDGHKDVNAQIHKEAMKKIVKKQTKLEIQKAMEQDATVYEYDSIYDDMKQKNAVKNLPAAVLSADKQKKPKYIGQLIKAAEHRAKEKLRVEERTIERERKKEGDQFSDKPAFVTSAYKKRMEERQKEEEEERRQAAIEDAMDVRKQRDLSGFYKHFLNRQVGEPSVKTEPE